MNLLSYDDAADLLSLPKGTLYSLVNQRRIPYVRLGPRLVRFDKNKLEAWVSDRSVSEGADA